MTDEMRVPSAHITPKDAKQRRSDRQMMGFTAEKIAKLEEHDWKFYESEDSLLTVMADALTAAERRGAEAMRGEITNVCINRFGAAALHYVLGEIRALPLPGDK